MPRHRPPRGVFLKSSAHPGAYGNFARLLGHYVRDEKLILIMEAVRRLASLPATNLGLPTRGALKPGYYADVVVFDPATIADRATFEKPHQYATGTRDVFVNGVAGLKDGEPSGATPGARSSGRDGNAGLDTKNCRSTEWNSSVVSRQIFKETRTLKLKPRGTRQTAAMPPPARSPSRPFSPTPVLSLRRGSGQKRFAATTSGIGHAALVVT